MIPPTLEKGSPNNRDQLDPQNPQTIYETETRPYPEKFPDGLWTLNGLLSLPSLLPSLPFLKPGIKGVDTVAKVEIRFDSDRPWDSEIVIDGEKVRYAYNVHVELAVDHVDFVLLKYIADQAGRIVCDEQGPRKETIHLTGPRPVPLEKVVTEK